MSILSKPPDVLIVMTRLPCEGRNKTRLIPALGASGATTMHDRLARHAVGRASSYAMMHPGSSLEVHLDGGSPDDGREWLGDVVCIAQHPGDLGQRMQAASDRAFSHGAKRVAIIGTDSCLRPVRALFYLWKKPARTYADLTGARAARHRHPAFRLHRHRRQRG